MRGSQWPDHVARSVGSFIRWGIVRRATTTRRAGLLGLMTRRRGGRPTCASTWPTGGLASAPRRRPSSNPRTWPHERVRRLRQMLVLRPAGQRAGPADHAGAGRAVVADFSRPRPDPRRASDQAPRAARLSIARLHRMAGAAAMNDDPSFKILMKNAEAMKRGVLPMWTIYEKPLDHPEGYIARRFESGKGVHGPTMDTIEGELEAIRDIFQRAGLFKLPRDDGDEPQIVETWV